MHIIFMKASIQKSLFQISNWNLFLSLPRCFSSYYHAYTWYCMFFNRTISKWIWKESHSLPKASKVHHIHVALACLSI